MGFDPFFKSGAGDHRPYPYQVRLAMGNWPETLVVPTGFGKTAAVFAAWLWKITQGDAETPRRLVYCLPMRTLVEQTENTAKKWIAAAKAVVGLEVDLDILMGGRGAGRRGLPWWMLYPERPAILIGTQDMLVSAALMRGYGTTRYRWPVDFALLHNDALWVFDEVQLTGATLATSAQIEAFRRRFGTGRDCRTLWMSATLSPTWLKTVDFVPADGDRPHDLSDSDLAQAQHLWAARKTLHSLDPSGYDLSKKDGLKSYVAVLATKARGLTKPGTNTILFINTVARAQATYEALGEKGNGPERLLVHSRFRKADRDQLMHRLHADPPDNGRIIVATQALEAGVDVTSATMITEIAPWSSLVQRFGRCNRNGERNETGADVFWTDLRDEDAKPYEPSDFAEARKKLTNLPACGPADLAVIPPSAPRHGPVIRNRDLFDLFDTDPDLSGFDVDVSAYVRDANDTDVRLFWRPIKGNAPPCDAPAPRRDELCPAPIGGARQFLERKGVRSWRWDTLVKEWRSIKKGDIFPGLVIWVDAAFGGYDSEIGFDASVKEKVEPIFAPDMQEGGYDDDPDTYTSKVRVSLAKHSIHVRDQAAELAGAFNLDPNDRDLIVEAALWHDLGKAHEAFVALSGGVLPPLAKWPSAAGNGLPQSPRKYFRHELASALAYLANRGWAKEASLAAYLIAAHHGKVRMRLRALPKEVRPENGLLFARGVWDGDELPKTHLGEVVVPKTKLDLDLMQLGEGPCGPSWSARTQGLLKQYGPFRLAWLEALVRIADWRASAAEETAGHDDL